MSKKTNSSIYHFKNYIQIQKLNRVLKIRFNNDELTLPGQNNQQTPCNRNKMGH